MFFRKRLYRVGWTKRTFGKNFSVLKLDFYILSNLKAKTKKNLHFIAEGNRVFTGRRLCLGSLI